MHSAMKQVVQMVMLGQCLRVPQNFEIFHGRLGPGLRDDVAALTH